MPENCKGSIQVKGSAGSDVLSLVNIQSMDKYTFMALQMGRDMNRPE